MIPAACRKFAPLALAFFFAGAHSLVRAEPRDVTSPTGVELGNDTEDIGKYLGPVIQEEASAIKIAPPVDSRVIHRAGLDLVSFVQDAKQWVGNVQTLNVDNKTTVDEYIKNVPGELTRTFRAVQVLDSRELMFQGRKAGRMSISMEGDLDAIGKVGGGGAKQSIALFRQILAVQMADKQFMILNFYTPLKDRDVATRTFDAMLTTFEILDREVLVKKRVEAIKRGKEWLAKRTADELKSKLIPQPQLFRMKIAGQDIGYIRFDEQEANRDNTQGILITVSSRAFPSNVAANLGQNTAYWAYSSHPHFSSWENTTKSIGPRPDGQPGSYAYWLREFGTLQLEGLSRLTPEEIQQLQDARDRLIKEKNLPPDRLPPAVEGGQQQYRIRVSLEGDQTQASQLVNQSVDFAFPNNAPSPLPKILEYVWPRVIDLNTPIEMTFAAFNSGSKKIVLRTLSVKGKDHIVVDRRPYDCIKCTDEIDTGSTTLWVDADGRILMMRTSDQTLLIPTTEPEMVKLWGSKLNAVNAATSTTPMGQSNR